MKNIVIDGHAHACGEYLTAEKKIAELMQFGAKLVREDKKKEICETQSKEM